MLIEGTLDDSTSYIAVDDFVFSTNTTGCTRLPSDAMTTTASPILWSCDFVNFETGESCGITMNPEHSWRGLINANTSEHNKGKFDNQF